MRLAIEQGELVKGHTYPNPPVGAVILDRDGEAVGVGATEPTGGRRGGRAGPRRQVGGRRHRRRHARAVATTWARPRPAWMPVWTGFRRSFTRWPIPIRSRPGERSTLLRPAWPICLDHQIASGRTASVHRDLLIGLRK